MVGIPNPRGNEEERETEWSMGKLLKRPERMCAI